jgi:hypothetical protein
LFFFKFNNGCVESNEIDNNNSVGIFSKNWWWSSWVMAGYNIRTPQQQQQQPQPTRPRVARMKMLPVYSIYHPVGVARTLQQADHPLSLPFFLSTLLTLPSTQSHTQFFQLSTEKLYTSCGLCSFSSSSSANWLHHSITTARIGRHVLTQPQQHGNGDCTAALLFLYKRKMEEEKRWANDCCCVMARQCHKTWWNYLCRYLSAEQGETTA